MGYKIWIPEHERPGYVATKENDMLESEISEEMWNEVLSYYVNLNRRRRKVTQKQIAQRIGLTQPRVCQMLKKPATIAKLWKLCDAMGGQLEVNVRFGNEVFSLLNEPDPNNPDAWMMNPDATTSAQ
jgi:predicted XRE-type DNA-binding protein